MTINPKKEKAGGIPVLSLLLTSQKDYLKCLIQPKNHEGRTEKAISLVYFYFWPFPTELSGASDL